ncbi:MAG TPA: SulP family inorganic anion transporter [Flavobacteriales bacterium]|nr:SulP family inorganic anion transporter [Flavobacteriales bacterium]HMR26280.1 SulP family inorganic anion transporter [Flavobacteriales bacterium]
MRFDRDLSEFVPKSFTVLGGGYTMPQFRRDVLAGVIVGIVALPLSIAFAIASGVAPEKGLVTAIVAGFFISAFGGSRVQIGGPTGAFIVIIYGIVQEHGVEGLTIATLLAGMLLVLLGLMRAGALLRYFPHTLIVGFTTGIAVIIFSTQINDLLGLRIAQVPADLLDKWGSYLHHAGAFDPVSFVVGVGTIAITVLTPRILPSVPGPLVAIVLATVVVTVFQLPVDTIGSRYGGIPTSLPAPHFAWVDLTTFKELLRPALAIALLGGIESLLSAVVADGSIGGRHRSNMELVAQGGANVVSALFGGIPATGAIARTATNIKNGGRTPVAGMVHAVVLLLILLVAGQWAALIPMACLAGILVVVAWNMAEVHSFIAVFRTSRYDMAVLLVTFLLTAFVDLVVAIEIGLVLAAFLFMKRMSDSTRLSELGAAEGTAEKLFESELGTVPSHVVIFEINGPLFFGAAQTFAETIRKVGDHHRVLILRMRHVPFIDATGLHRLHDIIRTMERRRVRVLLTDVRPEVQGSIQDAGLPTEGRLCPDIRSAIALAGGTK